MEQRFQPKELNKEDHKKIDKAAKWLKRGTGILMSVITIGIAAKGNEDKIGEVVKHIKKK